MSAPSDSQRPPSPSYGEASMEKIVSLCKRSGFIFQSSEIYGGLNGLWDYGPLGVELKRNLKNYWWRAMVHERDDIVVLDGSILMNRAVWKASGHEDTFVDMMRQCPFTNKRVRGEQVEPQSGTIMQFTGARSPAHWSFEGTFRVLMKPNEHIESFRKRVRSLLGANQSPNIAVRKFTEFKTAKEKADKILGKPEEIELLGEEKIGEAKDSVDFHPETAAQLSEPRPFNLMFKTFVGAT